MTPTLERTSDTEYVLTFPPEGRRRRTRYVIAFDPFFQCWGVDPSLPDRMSDNNLTLRAAVEQLVRHEGMIRENLDNADFEAEYSDAQAYLQNGDAP